ncbi:MAG: HAD hydrolase-like protein [Candidatus Nealsonbacteria bacterium]|nr:HAD hydrolase-like protein [Candidatus Nealsonbacteria bacterium]
MIKNIIFDWSGVIIDDLLTVYQAAMMNFEKLGEEKISLEEFKRGWEQPYMVFYSKYIPEITKEEQDVLYKESYKEAVLKYPFKPYPRIKDTLEKFKKAGFNMVILSSNHSEYLLSEIEEFDLDGFFSEVNGGVHDKFKAVAEMIKRNGFREKETLFVGDTTHEVEAGKSAGIKTASVTWGYHDENRLKSASPDFIIHNLKDLENIILG